MGSIGNKVIALTIGPGSENIDDVDANYSRMNIRTDGKLSSNLKGIMGLLRAAHRLIKENDIDLIVANTPISNLIALAIRFRCGRKRVQSLRIVHGMWAREMQERPESREIYGSVVLTEILPPISRFIEKFELSRTDQIIVVSEELQTYVEHITGRHGINVVPAGVDIMTFSPPDKSKQAIRQSLGLRDKKSVLFTGIIKEIKGLRFLVDASSPLLKKHDIQFVIVGNGPELPEIMKQIDNLELSGSFTFTGRVSDSQLIDYYRCADVYCLPSLWEGLPQSLLEAMSCGLPTVATSVGGIPSLIDDGENGLLIPAKDPVAIVEKVDYLLTRLGEADRIGANARATILDNYAWEEICARIKHIVNPDVNYT